MFIIIMKKLFYFYSFMNTNMNTLVCNTFYCKVLQIETRTENPCVGGSIPPLGTILLNFYFHYLKILKKYKLDLKY